MMKKLGTIGVVLGLVILGMSAVVSAQYGPQQSGNQNKNRMQYTTAQRTYAGDSIAPVETGVKTQTMLGQEENLFESQARIQYRNSAFGNEKSKAQFEGIWGYADDNTTQGYLAGRIERRDLTGMLRGFWNTTDNSTSGRIVGILKKGFFNGRYTSSDGEVHHVAGLMKIDRENLILKIRWLTAEKVGWAVCKIILI